MPNYRKLYYYLVGEIDNALTLMDDNNLLQWDRVKAVLQAALLYVEDEVINALDEPENP